MIGPIKTPGEHKAARAGIDHLLGAEANTPEAAELEVLGGPGHASEIMTGSIKRLSIGMIPRLHDECHMLADALIRDAA